MNGSSKKSVPSVKRLLMIYDAPSGVLAGVLDSVKKLVGTGCTLCTITHGVAGKRKTWREFEENTSIQIDYLHKDELTKIENELQQKITLPCIAVELDNGNIEVLLEKYIINGLQKLDPDLLIEAIKTQVSNKGFSLE